MTASRQAAEIETRPATAQDEELLLGWANDPTTRAASFRPETIEGSAHRAWLAERLASPSTRLLIGLQRGVPIGHVRFERGSDGTVDIGISVAPDARRRGLGRALLRAGLDAARGDVAFGAHGFVARVRVENEVSARLFRDAGFKLRDRSTCNGVPCLLFEIEA